MHLKRVLSEGYKSLDPIRLDMPEKLLFLIGLNGAGKSSTLQALAFIQFFAAGRPDDFFIERGWATADVRARTVEKPHHTLRHHLLFEKNDLRILWQFAWGLNSRSTITEQMWISVDGADPHRLFRFNRRSGLSSEGEPVKGLTPAGSVLNVLDPSAITSRHADVREVLDWCTRITSLELLNPHAMRGNVRGTPRGIGTRGQRLSGFLASLDSKTKARIVERLSDFYPLEALSTSRKKAGWVDLRISESYGLGPVPAHHVSDGFLRLLALCSIPEFGSRSSLVLLDEIEDGIEPHVLPRIIERVVEDSSAQFVMTSHSPLLINFFDAKCVTLVTRAQEGRSKFVPLSDIGTVKDGLDYFGPGEIWANTGLQALTEGALEASRARDLADADWADVSTFTDEWVHGFMGQK